jgi:hypothetical protein
MIESMEQYEEALDELFRIEMIGYENYETEYIEKLVEDIRKFEENELMTDKEKEELQEQHWRG